MTIADNLKDIKSSFHNPTCLLIAVSKTKPIENLLEAYGAGVRDFGENKVQELQAKEPQLPKDIRWHMIGHLQRNKVKYIAPFIYLIHSVDSFKLLKEINKQGEKIDRKISVLLQIHIAEEESKFGFDISELEEMLDSEEFKKLSHVTVKGLMGMATLTSNQDQIRKEFKRLKALFEEIKNKELPDFVQLTELSMGMSSDYQVAQEEGSTMVRIGSSIFGARNYN
ncbi:YggS family pyridoxal phosphate-dependent enzyme [Algoriphagus sp.]|uniref:YggS family pyridoxal phosphate-dependent enzyme n=1 Tax=Algoriphagus sp. TaxID=1872435 RepID=UPI002612C927|nr:YggS family pyridoxal phosphate-dependent enzyme [Algoriphagus sp.]